MTRLAILTGGGDAPGLNAVIRAAVKTAFVHNCEILGVRDGFDGFLSEKGVYPLSMDDVRGILPRGGTILGAANRGNPLPHIYKLEATNPYHGAAKQRCQKLQDKIVASAAALEAKFNEIACPCIGCGDHNECPASLSFDVLPVSYTEFEGSDLGDYILHPEKQ